MLSHKRKHAPPPPSDSESETGYSSADVFDLSDEEVDISSALTTKRPRLQSRKAGGGYDDDDDDLADIIRTATTKANVKGGTEMLKKTKGKSKIIKGEVGGGSFQSMGIFPWLLRSLTLQGFRIPTPIQRLAIPALLTNPPRDLVGMARTGSGKSLAYLIPLVQRLGGRHSTTFGSRALILIPTRELALQILKVGKELSRGWHAGEGDHAGDRDAEDVKKGSGLRWGLVVGGEGLDEQFEMISNNPDVIIATPGRLLHLIVEMNLDLKGVQYVVFDEADRLFEMGFETALTEILHRLPGNRQTLLFSATLPKSLVEFAKAGLQNPKLVRLDAESKISSDLKMGFFSVKQAEKDASLLVLLRDVIGVPLGSTQPFDDDEPEAPDRKGKSKAKAKYTDMVTAPHQTLVFAATKHHVEYLTNLLSTAGYAVSHIYGTLDQAARGQQMDRFRRGMASILVVTDVAARGIDIPVLENVVNYDFPHGARVFVHRVGRTARAGRQGWAWSFVTNAELPYLLDLQLFLGRPIKNTVTTESDQIYTEALILGPFDRDRVDDEAGYIRKLEDVNHNLPTLRDVMKKGHAMYERSKGKASQASYKRTKEMMKDGKWGLVGNSSSIHPVCLRNAEGGSTAVVKKLEEEDKRKALLQAVSAFRPAETVLEIGSRGNAETAALMKQRRKALSKAVERASYATTSMATQETPEEPEDNDGNQDETADMEMADEETITAVFNPSGSARHHRDSEFYMSHYQKGANTEKGYSLRDGATFTEQAQGVTFDLAGDDDSLRRKRRELHWDKKKKKFVQGSGEGADNVKMVKTESGAKLPASYRSGRFDEWKAKNRLSLPKVGEIEDAGRQGGPMSKGGRKWKHNQVVAAKPLDRHNHDYERKLRQQKKNEAEGGAKEGANSKKPVPGAAKKKWATGKRTSGKSMDRVKSELKTVDQIRKTRKTMDNKRAKNARPTHKGKRR